MSRYSTGNRLLASIAFFAMLCASTAIAWASPCVGACAMQAPASDLVGAELDTQPGESDEHSCCPGEEPVEDSKLFAATCCGGDPALSCRRATLVLQPATSLAHERTRACADRPLASPPVIVTLERIPLKIPIEMSARRAASPLPDERYTTTTIVLLI